MAWRTAASGERVWAEEVRALVLRGYVRDLIRRDPVYRDLVRTRVARAAQSAEWLVKDRLRLTRRGEPGEPAPWAMEFVRADAVSAADPRFAWDNQAFMMELPPEPAASVALHLTVSPGYLSARMTDTKGHPVALDQSLGEDDIEIDLTDLVK